MSIKTGLHNLTTAFLSLKIILISLLILIGLYALSVANYLVYHTFVELVRVVILWMFFTSVWNKRKDIHNDYLIVLGMTLPIVSILVIIHTLAFKGMNILTGFNTDLPTQLWIAERYVIILAFLLGPYFLWREEKTGKRLNPHLTIIAVAIIVATILLSLFHWRNFPSCYIDGRGLTLFKIMSEYIIIIAIFAAIGLLETQRRRFDPDLLRWLIFFLFFNAIADLAFTTYINVYGLANFLGHMFLLVAVYFLFKAAQGIRRMHNPDTSTG